MGTDVFVECEVTEGMFSDEAVVELADRTFVVPKATIQSGASDRRPRVRARLIKDGGKEWIVLPTVYSDSIPRTEATIVRE